MLVSRLTLKNWRNFQRVNDIPLRQRQFIVGPNASGKSNLLDVFRFLRDIAKSEGGGLQKAVKERGGISKLRCLAARRDPEILIDISLSDDPDEKPLWRYAIGIRQETRGYRQPILSFEHVWKGNKQILKRPDAEDKKDSERLKQTFLEQVNTNAKFREIVRYLDSVSYIHLVPQLLRYGDFFQTSSSESDPFGQGFLVRVAKSAPRTQKFRLGKIENALKIAVPQLEQLRFERDDDTGKPHLAALYSHWRPKAGWQREDQFSDGTLRLIGILWALLDSDALLLLEEPELSLNDGIVSQLAPLIYRMQRQRKRQVLVSTHSESLLSDKGIDGREVLLLSPGSEGTSVDVSGNISDVRPLLEAGLSVGEVVLPRSRPLKAEQLGLFK
ncbi:AAA family ATPase [Desulfonema magnum]|uniref:AAA ATPase-like domain-containing protein n=1 Tax=Desulfonema magnum TaxID=45655 RepID=A0A975BV31_9BACT|nr:ATP-binding protein [Desulfonema magnum]QTA92042.1 AAA ATPase-like domain-containing protein [Desulfonema magnum]